MSIYKRDLQIHRKLPLWMELREKYCGTKVRLSFDSVSTDFGKYPSMKAYRALKA